jgi:hypothetical protein
MRQSQEGKKLTTYVKESIQHGEILAASRGGSSYYAPGRACKTKAGPPRRGQVDLVFVPRGVPEGKHSKRPPPAGPALRFCGSESGFAPMLAVKDPREAKQIAAKYQRCLRDDAEKTQDECIVEVTGKPVESLSFGERATKAPVRRRKVAPRGPRASTNKSTFLFPWQRR